MKLKIVLLLASVILFSNCNNYKIVNMNTIKGSGKITEKTFPINDISMLESPSIYNIYIKQGETEELKLETDDNMIDFFKYDIEGKSLTLTHKSGNFSPTKANIYITLKNIQNIINSGSGNIYIEKFSLSSVLTCKNAGSGNVSTTNLLSSDELIIKNAGSGNINLNGKAKSLDLLNTGSGNINAFELISDFVKLKNTGTGNFKIYCNKELSIVNTGTGNIKYKGDAIIKEITSSGIGNISKAE